MKSSEIGKVVVWSDQHFPFVNEQAHSAIYAFSKAQQPDYHLHIGDCLDLGGLARQEPDNYIKQYEEPIEAGLVTLGRHFNKLFEITPKAKIVWIWGNHEERLIRFVAKNPSWRGLLDNPLKLIKGFGDCPEVNRVKLVILGDFEDEYKIGRMRFAHGFWPCKHTAAKHVEAYDDSITFGHAHTMQMFTIQKQRPRAGYCVGHLMDKRARRYLKGQPTRWVTGFGFMEYLKKGGQFNMFLIPIVNGSFLYGGKKYQAKDKRTRIR